MGRLVMTHILSSRWAMTEESLRSLIGIAARAVSDKTLAQIIRGSRPISKVQAVQAIEGRYVDGSQGMTMRNGIATIELIGPLIRYGSFFSSISGSTSIERFAQDFALAMNDPAVRGVLIACDSEGGEVNGTQETAELIYAARGVKPIWAHISGDGCSAAHWIVSAASRILAGPTSVVGSIGVRAAFTDYTAWEKKQGIETIEFVSSQSPKKAIDPTTPEGRQAVQKLLDDLAEVFVDTEARNRGVSVETVLSDFGQGGVFVGAEAQDAGLVDEIGTFEEVHADMEATVMNARRTIAIPGATALATTKPAAEGGEGAPPATELATPPGAPTTDQGVSPKDEGAGGAATPDPAEAAATAERERLASIDALMRPGAESLIAKGKADPHATAASVALAIMTAEDGGRKKRLTALAQDVVVDPPPAAAPTGDSVESGSAKSLLATLSRVNQERAAARRIS